MMFVKPRSSVTDTWNESEPKKFGLGEYVQFPSAGWIVAEPLDGSEAIAKTEPSESPSASVALRSPDAVESSKMDALVSPEISDASSMELTDRLIVTSEDEFKSSVTDTWNESEPKKFGLGEYVQFPSDGWIVADPLDGSEAMAKTEPSESPSASVALRSPTAVESSEMDALVSPEISDASSMELTDRLIVTSEDEFRSSVTDTWNESEPKKFGLGEYVQFPSAGWIVAEPLDGSEAMAKTEPSESPSASVALRSPDAVESSLMDALVSPEISDASSMELTDRLIVTREDEFRSSVTETWNESEPKKFGLGEYVQFPSAGWIVADPLDGSEAMANTEPSESPSASDALRSPDAEESSEMDALVSPETTMNLDHP